MHIVFQKEDINTLSKSFALDESLAGEIIGIKDDYSVGPLKDPDSPAATEERKLWWQQVLSGGDFRGLLDGETGDAGTMEEVKNRLNDHPEETVWIWVAPNKQDVSGYYQVITWLKEFVGRVYVLSLNNLPFINDKGTIFYPKNLSEIPPREFLKAKKLARAVTASEFETDPDEWTKICKEKKGLRILEGGKKLRQQEYDFFDDGLKKFITADWQKASKIIHQFLSKENQPVNEMYLLWRLKTMISQDLFDVQGKVENMKDFELKQKV